MRVANEGIDDSRIRSSGLNRAEGRAGLPKRVMTKTESCPVQLVSSRPNARVKERWENGSAKRKGPV